MSLVDLLEPDAVMVGLVARTKKQLFQQLAERAAPLFGVNGTEIVRVVSRRERLGSTGFGGGVAIPHGKIDGLEHPQAVFAQLAEPLDYDAIDHLPVDLVVMLLSPADGGMQHLKALAGVSRTLRDASFVAKLRGAASADAVWALISQEAHKNAA